MVAAREVAREGHNPTVYEQSAELGGVWAYTGEVECTDLREQHASKRVHSSMYAGLRTNLPREVMSYLDFPFDAGQARAGFGGDPRTFPGHAEVLAYLKAFAEAYGLERYVRYNTAVQSVERVQQQQQQQGEDPDALGVEKSRGSSELPWPTWRVTTAQVDATAPSIANGGSSSEHATSMGSNARPSSGSSAGPATHASTDHRSGGSGSGSCSTVQYDAVMICNGHYSDPLLPGVEGMEAFTGRQLHSHNYRRPQGFKGGRVLVVGAANSGIDISREVAEHAAEVIWCARSWKDPDALSDPRPVGLRKNIWRRPMLARLSADQSAELEDGTVVQGVDAVIYATGYKYAFPFLRDGDLRQLIGQDSRTVHPVYQHVFPACVAPSLAFIGLPWEVVPFPLFEMQSKWIARVFSGRAQLPSMDAMLLDAERYAAERQASGFPRRHLHRMGPLQWEYLAWIGKQLGEQPLPSWRRPYYEATSGLKQQDVERYRDLRYDPGMETLVATGVQQQRVLARQAAAEAAAAAAG